MSARSYTVLDAIRFVSEVASVSLYKTEGKDAESALLALNYLILKARSIEKDVEAARG